MHKTVVTNLPPFSLSLSALFFLHTTHTITITIMVNPRMRSIPSTPPTAAPTIVAVFGELAFPSPYE